MKKTFKRAGVAVLSMAMLLSMGAMGTMSASAAKDNTTPITVTAPASAGADTATYTIYKVCDATPNAAGTSYTYSMATGFTTDIKDILDCEDTAAAKKTLADKLVADAADATAVATVNSGSSTTLVAGYYLAVMNPTGTTMTAAPILFSIDSETNAAGISLSTKTSEVSLVKEITAVDKGSVATSNKRAEGAIGAVVSYQVEATIPNYAETVKADDIEYALIDIPSAGLTVDTTSVALATTGTGFAADDYTLTATANRIKVKFDGAYVKKNGGKKVTMTYDATINENALISTTDAALANPNTVRLYYDNDYYTASKTGNPTENPDKPDGTPDGGELTEKEDEAEVYTTKLLFKKLFNGDDTAIAGANFTLSGPNGFSETFETTASKNSFEFDGLQAGTYTLHENAAPGGYVQNTNDITIGINSKINDATTTYEFAYTNANSSDGVSFTMNNTPKGTLPGTGGMGTVLFTVGGAAIVLMAGFLFVLYMKKKETEE